MPRPPARSRRPGARANARVAEEGAVARADPRVAALLGGDPAAFTRGRDALARALADEGDAAGAARVRKLRRPTAATALLNRLAREAPDEVARLLAAGGRLAGGGARGGGGPAALREANAALRAALDALLRVAAGLAAEGGRAPPAALLARVERGLRAIAGGPEELRRGFSAGLLEREPAPAEVDLLGGLAAMAPPEAGGGRDRDRDREPDRDHDRDHDRKPDRDPERGERERARVEARRRADEEVRRAVEEVEAAERALSDARRRLADARRAREQL